MPAEIRTTQVGPWSMNTYVIVDTDTGLSAIVDPGADAAKILALAEGTRVDKILLTHAHHDHWGALDEVRSATGAPVYMHPAETQTAPVDFDEPLAGGDTLMLGTLEIAVVHTPGHAPGLVCFVVDDQNAIVGDTLFVGGPGRTWNAAQFDQTMRTLQDVVFRWPDDMRFHPGHGPSGSIGQERAAFEAFVARGWPADLFGDVTWE